jgi:hypothetical protein
MENSMPTVTDRERWLDHVNLESSDAVYSLYNTVHDEEGCGDFQCSSRGKELYVKSSNSEEWLLIATKLARKDFLNILKTRYFGGENVQIWYAKHGESMSKTG